MEFRVCEQIHESWKDKENQSWKMDAFNAYVVGLKEEMTDEEILETKKKERMSFVCENYRECNEKDKKENCYELFATG